MRLTDAGGNPMSGVAASWVVTAGAGMVGSAATTTDAAGVAQVPWTLGRTFLANAVTASATGRAVTFTATGQGSGSLQGRLPFPADTPIEGGLDATGDRHVLVLDWDNWKLYELFDARPLSGGARWTAGSGAIFDLNSNQLRPAGWASADAAGLPIFPGLVRYDE